MAIAIVMIGVISAQYDSCEFPFETFDTTLPASSGEASAGA
jgi:hypothetical protein